MIISFMCDCLRGNQVSLAGIDYDKFQFNRASTQRRYQL
jgi:hypothetical protein